MFLWSHVWNAGYVTVKSVKLGHVTVTRSYTLFQVFREIQDNGIQIFVPELFEDDDASNAAIKEIRNTIPFAVVGSNTLLEVNGKKIRGRVYPWGVVEGVSTCRVSGDRGCEYKRGVVRRCSGVGKGKEEKSVV